MIIDSGISTGSLEVSGSFSVQGSSSLSQVLINGTLTITGSLNVSGSVEGTASLATSASYAETASYVLNAVSSSFAATASYVLQGVSSSFASTASYVLDAVSSSFATTASLAQTALFAVTASYALNAGSGGGGAAATYFYRSSSLEGTVDLSWGGTGINSNGIIRSMVLQSDGKLIVVGAGISSYNSTGSSANIIRMFTSGSGSRDLSFISGNGFNDTAFSVTLDSSGSVYVAGNYTTYNTFPSSVVTKLDSSGTLDTTFRTNLNPLTSSLGQGRVVRITSDQKLMLGTSITKGLYKLSLQGVVDATFNTGSGFNGAVWDVVETSDGDFIAVGTFTSYTGTTSNRVAKLNSSGIIDATFATNIGTGPNNTVFNVGLQSDGKILVVGDFTTFNGVPTGGIARLNTNGTLDTSFNYGTNAPLAGLRILPDDTFFVGNRNGLAPFLTNYDGVPVAGFIKVQADGTIAESFRYSLLAPPSASSVTSGGPAAWAFVTTGSHVYVGGQWNQFDGLNKAGIVRVNTLQYPSASFGSKLYATKTSANTAFSASSIRQTSVFELIPNVGWYQTTPPTSGDWIMAGTCSISAVTTSPTKANTRQRDSVRYRKVNSTTYEVEYNYAQDNNTGAAAGTGNYIVSLPTGLTFYSGTLATTSGVWEDASNRAIPTVGSIFFTTGDSARPAQIVPYSDTQFQTLILGTTAGSGVFWSPTSGSFASDGLTFKLRFYTSNITGQ